MHRRDADPNTVLRLQGVGDLGQGDVPIRRLDQRQDEGLVGVELGAPGVALTAGFQAPSRPPGTMPRARRRFPDGEPTRRLPRRRAGLDGFDDTLAQINPKRSSQRTLPEPIPLGSGNHDQRAMGIPRLCFR